MTQIGTRAPRRLSPLLNLLIGRLLPCLGLLASGCGSIPDLKVIVNLVPSDATQLWVLMWQGPERLPVKELLQYELTPPVTAGSYTYSFGITVTDLEKNLVISTAAFKKGASGFCFRTGGTAVQPAGYALLTTLPILLDEDLAQDGLAATCYDTLTNQQKPLITGLTFQIERLSGSQAATGVLYVNGWNFSPKATVTLNVSGDNVTPSSPSEIVQDQPNQIRFLLSEEKISRITFGVTVTVTVTNPGVEPFVYSTRIFGR